MWLGPRLPRHPLLTSRGLLCLKEQCKSKKEFPASLGVAAAFSFGCEVDVLENILMWFVCNVCM